MFPRAVCLGPSLFLGFIIDIGDGIQDSQFRLFADDLKVFNNFNAQSVQADINSLSEWSELNNLDFHPKKCKVIVFSRKNKSDQLMLGCNPLPFVEEMDDLGFIISNHLSWKRHVDSKLLKIKKSFLFFLKRNIPFSTSSKRKKLLYSSLTLPILLYGSSVWCMYSNFVLLPVIEQNIMIIDTEVEVLHETILITKTIDKIDTVLHLEIDFSYDKSTTPPQYSRSRYDTYKRDSRSYRSPYRSSYSSPL